MGAPTLHDTVAELMSVTGADPELLVVREPSDGTEPPRWSVVLRADDHAAELELDIRVPEAGQAAIALLLISLVDDLRAELPSLMNSPIVMDGVVRLLMAGTRRKSTGQPS